jgi:hypothetical protein
MTAPVFVYDQPMSPNLRERTIRILLRITEEQVPPMASDRFKKLRADCRKLLADLITEGGKEPQKKDARLLDAT